MKIENGKSGFFVWAGRVAVLAINPWGNCFSGLVVKTAKGKGNVARVSVTLRTGCVETTAYWRGGFRFDWNSGHLARRFGTEVETDFGGFRQWRGHTDI
jgi:hypothetical protein